MGARAQEAMQIHLSLLELGEWRTLDEIEERLRRHRLTYARDSIQEKLTLMQLGALVERRPDTDTDQMVYRAIMPPIRSS